MRRGSLATAAQRAKRGAGVAFASYCDGGAGPAGAMPAEVSSESAAAPPCYRPEREKHTKTPTLKPRPAGPQPGAGVGSDGPTKPRAAAPPRRGWRDHHSLRVQRRAPRRGPVDKLSRTSRQRTGRRRGRLAAGAARGGDAAGTERADHFYSKRRPAPATPAVPFVQTSPRGAGISAGAGTGAGIGAGGIRPYARHPFSHHASDSLNSLKIRAKLSFK